MHILSCENKFYLHVNENSFSFEKLCIKTRFEKEAQDNSEIAYYSLPNCLLVDAVKPLTRSP